jgi:hypothetical protein
MRQILGVCLIGLLMVGLTGAAGAEDKVYVGSQACKDCHEKEYEKFSKFSRKSHSFSNIKKMEKKLTPEEYKGCFQCHTTGYGQAGGFVSEEKTPELKNPGCEVCHGPGSRHAETGDPYDIITQMDTDNCTVCHNEARNSEFNFNPLLFGGAH